MLERIRSALVEIGTHYADARIQLCKLEAIALAESRCSVSGVVLDAATLAAVTGEMAARFPEFLFDTTSVRILRLGAPVRRVVATSVTGLHAQPSFLAELLSQLLNGWTAEILLEQDRWAFLSIPGQAGDGRGYLGWAYQPHLADLPAPEPTHLVREPVALLRTAPGGAALAGRVMGGTGVRAVSTEGRWVKLDLAGGQTGWTGAADLRSYDQALAGDEAARRGQLIADAGHFIGVPYLWGGCTALGIDCSGFAQLLHRLNGVIIPRDADQQFEAGKLVVSDFRPGDLFFFGEGDRRKITHVGVSLGGWRMIHSSRSRNGVYEDDPQAVEHLRTSFIGARSFLGK